MIRCESIGCPDVAIARCSFYDWEGRDQTMRLCLLHSDQLMRHSWYRAMSFLYPVTISDELLRDMKEGPNAGP